MANEIDVGRIDELLEGWRQGDKTAYNELTELLHADLVRIAHLKFRGERVSHTLETHALVNNLYLKLFHSETVPWESYLHFLNAAAKSMHLLLIDHARAWGRRAQGSSDPIDDSPLRDLGVKELADVDDYIALAQALERYAAMDPDAEPIAQLKILGFTFEEIAQHTDIEISKVKREWKLIRKYLLKNLYRQ